MQSASRRYASGTRDGKVLYFAYGSNLHVSQMASRCPESKFVGKGSLPHYRWQINQRGVANIVKSDESIVEGLVYLVGPADEKTLDRSEGVAKGFYQKQLLTIRLEPHHDYHDTESSSVVEKLQGIRTDETVVDTVMPDASCSEVGPEPSHLEIQQVKALVYVSEKYKDDGDIRDEYVGRMQKAKHDALQLGVAQAFIEEQIDPCIVRRRDASVPQGTVSARKEEKPEQKVRRTRRPDQNLIARSQEFVDGGTSDTSEGNIRTRRVRLSPEGRKAKAPDSEHQVWNLTATSPTSSLLERLEILKRPPMGAIPADLLDLIGHHEGDRRQDASQDNTSQDDTSQAMVYVVVEEFGHAETRVRNTTASRSLDLANQLALAEFCRAYGSHFSGSELSGQWCKDGVEESGPSHIRWKLEAGLLIISMSSSAPDQKRIRIRVEKLEYYDHAYL